MKRYVLFALFLLSISPLFAQINGGEVAIGGIRYDFGSGIVQTWEGDFVIAGSTSNYEPYYSGSNMYIIKIDSTGKVKWTKVCAGYEAHAIKLITTLDQQRIIVIGDYSGSDWPSSEMICYDTAGHLLWSRNVQSNKVNNDPSFYAMASGQNNNLMVIGGWGTYATLGEDISLMNEDFCDTLPENGAAVNLYRYNSLSGKLLSAHFLIDTGFHLADSANNYNSSFNTNLYACGIAATKDGGYLITGGIGINQWPFYTTSSAMLLKIDSTGNFLWAKKYTGTDSIGMAIINTTDGGFAITGITNTNHIYVEKLDSAYNITWEHTISGAAEDHPENIIQTKDGGYAIIGLTKSSGNGSTDVYLVKLDSLGNMQWDKTIGGTYGDGGRAVMQYLTRTKTWGYAIAGYTNSFGYAPDSINVYFVKTDSSGNVCDARNGTGKMGTASNSISYVTLKDTLSDKDTTEAYIYSGDSVVIVCNSTLGIDNIPAPNNSVTVYPNPFNTYTTIVFNNNNKHYLEVDDVTGRKLESIECSGKEYELQRGNLAPGIYFIRMFDANRQCTVVQKIVVE